MTPTLNKKPLSPEIEELLIKNNVVTGQEIEKAKSEAFVFNKKASMPVGLILAKENNIKESELLKIFSNEAVYKKASELISNHCELKNKNISALIKRNNNASRLLTELVNENIISLDEKNLFLNKILDLKKTAKTLADMGLVTEQALEAAFRKKKKKMSFCEILYEQHLVTLAELNHIFITLDNSLKLGGILLNLGLIDEKILNDALEEQSKSGHSFGSILVNKNKISVQQLYFALSIQYNIPFRQLTNFTYSDSQKIELKSIIDKKSAGKNLLIPILLTGDNLMLGVFNPSHAADINDIMSKYSNLKISCVLITHNKFEQLYTLLYSEILNTRNDLISSKDLNCTSDKKTVISNPDSQYRLINDLFERYLKLLQSENQNNFSPDRNAFHDFIRENFKKICSGYNCSHVSFWFDFSNEKLKIMASPVSSAKNT